MTVRIITVVVTFNRKQLLLRCLEAVASQTSPPGHILIVDNASTDGTREHLENAGWLVRNNVEYLHLATNMGGAGGFARGMEHAVAQGAQWLWTMDDDGYPEHDCLERLLNAAKTRDIASVAPIHLNIEAPDKLAFRTLDARGHELASPPDLSDGEEVFISGEANLFNGWLVNATVVREVGLPREELFLRGDEVEYVRRMHKRGVMFGTLANARFYHPTDRDERVHFLGRIGRARDAHNAFKNYYMYRNKALAFLENGQWWLLPFDFARYVYYFVVVKRGDLAGLRLWWKATHDGLAKRLGRHPDF